jgi:acid stress-induced BolA-like protein IbaG/YrbA
MDPAVLVARIRTELPDALIEVQGEECSFAVSVVSSAFEGVRALARQQTILRLFARELAQGELHALSVSAKTLPELRASLVAINPG